MHLDPRTLLFSLILANMLMVVSLFVAASGKGQKQGLGKWALAISLDTLVWVVVAARGVIPETLSIVLANLFKAASYAFMLIAIHEFQRRRSERWKFFVPVAGSATLSVLLMDDIGARFVWGSVIYAAQVVLILQALLSDTETSKGRAWRLLFAGALMILAVLALRAIVAFFGMADFAQPQDHNTLHWVQVIVFIAAMTTALLGSLGFVLMIKERTDREVMHLAMTDSLTGVPNRRALMDLAARALAQRNNRPISLMMIDVDHFKRINDTYGHPAGDEVLRQASGLMQRRLRAGDVIGRYGGEEFCVIAPDTDTEGAWALAESLREIMAEMPLQTEAGEIAITVSIGFTCCMTRGPNALQSLLSEADKALYQAKQEGRNRVVRAEACADRLNG